jgi:hypothetical protein
LISDLHRAVLAGRHRFEFAVLRAFLLIGRRAGAFSQPPDHGMLFGIQKAVQMFGIVPVRIIPIDRLRFSARGRGGYKLII